VRALGRLWRGELPLDAAFWNWAVIGGLLVNISTTIAFYVLIMNGRPVPAFAIGYALSISYNIMAAVGVWRAADRHTGSPRHAAWARWSAVVLLGLLSMT
jgi:hypothetical protein